MANAGDHIVIPLDQVDFGLNLIGDNILSFIQDNYALMRQRSDWHAVALAIFALEELVKYAELKRLKELAIRANSLAIEVDKRLFGHGRNSHEYKLTIAKEKELIPLDAWTIHAGYFRSEYFSRKYFDTPTIISGALRLQNIYVDWKGGEWLHGSEVVDPSRLKTFVDSISKTLERLKPQ